MKIQRFAIGLTVLNLLILMSGLFRANSAATPALPPVLRVRGLELEDDQGRVRAMLKVFPAQTNYPETVLLRLIDSKGAPNVKIAATEDGSALSFVGEAGYVQILSRGTNLPVVKLVTKSGKERFIKPE